MKKPTDRRGSTKLNTAKVSTPIIRIQSAACACSNNRA